MKTGNGGVSMGHHIGYYAPVNVRPQGGGGDGRGGGLDRPCTPEGRELDLR